MLREPIFKLGDLVVLKSGSPTMTIEHLHEFNEQFGGDYDCIWFVGNEIKRTTFIEEVLEKYVNSLGYL